MAIPRGPRANPSFENQMRLMRSSQLRPCRIHRERNCHAHGVACGGRGVRTPGSSCSRRPTPAAAARVPGRCGGSSEQTIVTSPRVTLRSRTEARMHHRFARSAALLCPLVWAACVTPGEGSASGVQAALVGSTVEDTAEPPRFPAVVVVRTPSSGRFVGACGERQAGDQRDQHPLGHQAAMIAPEVHTVVTRCCLT